MTAFSRYRITMALGKSQRINSPSGAASGRDVTVPRFRGVVLLLNVPCRAATGGDPGHSMAVVSTGPRLFQTDDFGIALHGAVRRLARAAASGRPNGTAGGRPGDGRSR